MPGNHDVYIFENEDGEFRVRPAVSPVLHGNGLKVRNLTDYRVTLRFPNGVLKGRPLPHSVTSALPSPLPAALTNLLDQVPPQIEPRSGENFHFKDPNLSGVVTYGVDVETPNGTCPAEGESQPKIIVDP